MTPAACRPAFRHRLPLVLLGLFLLLFLGPCPPAPAGDAADWSGTYAGSFDGALSGFWVASFDEKGFGRLAAWWEADQEADYGIGNVTADGHITLMSYLGCAVSAQVDGQGQVTGTWTAGDISGPLAGSRQPAQALGRLAGLYQGTCQAEEPLTWQVTVAADGMITGHLTTAEQQQVAIQGGGTDADGRFVMRAADGTSLTGDLDADGTASGAWYKEVATGELSGQRQAAAAGTGSGICFVGQLP